MDSMDRCFEIKRECLRMFKIISKKEKAKNRKVIRIFMKLLALLKGLTVPPVKVKKISEVM